MLEHQRTWSCCLPAASLLIKSFTISSVVTAETFFEVPKKLESWTSKNPFVAHKLRLVPVRFLKFCKALVDLRHVHMESGSFDQLTRRRIAGGLAKFSITVIWVRATGTPVSRFPRAFDLQRQVQMPDYQEQIQQEAHRSPGRGLALNSREVREGKSNKAGSPFLSRRRESTAIAWSIAHQ